MVKILKLKLLNLKLIISIGSKLIIKLLCKCNY